MDIAKIWARVEAQSTTDDLVAFENVVVRLAKAIVAEDAEVWSRFVKSYEDEVTKALEARDGQSVSP